MTKLKEKELSIGKNIRGFNSPGSMSEDYLNLKSRIEERLNDQKKSLISIISNFIKNIYSIVSKQIN